MKKSTGILLLISFFVVILILVGVFVSLVVYLMQGTTPNLLGKSRIALVRVEGVIFDAEDWIKQIRDYQKNNDIKAIVLRVDSPGGGVGPSQELYHAILEARSKYGKVIVASFASVAASGGYYIAAGADHIVSTPGTMTGSIGVYAQFLQAQELMDKIGIDYNTVKAGRYKTAGSYNREMTDYERDMFQSVIDDTYNQFIEAVVHGRRNDLIQFMKDWKPEDAQQGYPFTEDVVSILQTYYDARQGFLASRMDGVNSTTAAVAMPRIVPRVARAVDSGTDEATEDVDSSTVENSEDVDSATEEIGEDVDSGNAESAEETLAATDEIIIATDVLTGATDGEAISGKEHLEKMKDEDFPPEEDVIFALAKAMAEGKIYTGRQAYQLALVDDIGTLDDAIRAAADLVGITGEPTVVERKQRELTLFDLLTQKLQIFNETKAYSPLQYRFPY